MNIFKKFNDQRFLTGLILAVGGILILSVVGFAGFYYWDRYVHLGDQSPMQKSLSQLEDEVRSSPNDINSRMSLAEMYLVDQNYAKAINQATQVIKVEPENERALFVLGISYASTGQFDSALPYLEKFTSIRASNPMAKADQALETAYYYLGASYIEIGNLEGSIQVLNLALEINQTDADAMFKLGQAYAKAGQNNQAILNYENAVRFVPDFGEAYQGMLEIYISEGKKDYVNYARGMLAYSKRDLKKAVSELENAAVTITTYSPLYLGLGLTYEDLGDLVQAKKYLQQGLELDPNNFTIQQALSRIQERK